MTATIPHQRTAPALVPHPGVDPADTAAAVQIIGLLAESGISVKDSDWGQR